jgi:membrane protease YdiL (CAAX protease family)
MSPATAVAWVLFVGVAPGVSEEIFFRGLVQRRLATIWSPAAAIGTASALFAVVHIDPPVVAMAFVLGCWLGVLAWRTGSTWPGIVTHALINALWNAGQIVIRKSEATPTQITAALVIVAAVSLVCFVAAVAILKCPRQQGIAAA